MRFLSSVFLLLFTSFSSAAFSDVLPSDKDIQGIKNLCGGGNIEVVDGSVGLDAVLGGWARRFKANLDVAAAKKNLAFVLGKVSSDAGGTSLYTAYVGCVEHMIGKFLDRKGSPLPTPTPTPTPTPNKHIPWIGATFQNITKDIANKYQLSTSYGAFVLRVEPGSPAEKAGICEGDIVVQFNGVTITNEIELIVKELERIKSNKAFKIGVVREDVNLTLWVRPYNQGRK